MLLLAGGDGGDIGVKAGDVEWRRAAGRPIERRSALFARGPAELALGVATQHLTPSASVSAQVKLPPAAMARTGPPRPRTATGVS